MANDEHLAKLHEGAKAWNEWRREYFEIEPDLSGANLAGANLAGANLSRTNLSEVNLRQANLSRANLSEAKLFRADLFRANGTRANLSKSNLNGTGFYRANLSSANLSGAYLAGALLVETDLRKSDLTGCTIYGLSVWNVRLNGAIQKSLRITPVDEPEITVDNLDVAQFIYLMLNNANLRQVIETTTSKVVLILGRFTSRRIAILHAIRRELRKHDYLPVVFDFEKPGSRNLTETVSTLAHMARFVIADVTDAKSIPQELQRIVPDLPSVPVQPLLLSSQQKYGMFDDFGSYPWVLKPFPYKSHSDLLRYLQSKVIGPAEERIRKERPPSNRK